jgi:hypothetical protein
VIISVTVVIGTAILTALMNGMGQVLTAMLKQIGGIVPGGVTPPADKQGRRPESLDLLMRTPLPCSRCRARGLAEFAVTVPALTGIVLIIGSPPGCQLTRCRDCPRRASGSCWTHRTRWPG